MLSKARHVLNRSVLGGEKPFLSDMVASSVVPSLQRTGRRGGSSAKFATRRDGRSDVKPLGLFQLPGRQIELTTPPTSPPYHPR